MESPSSSAHQCGPGRPRPAMGVCRCLRKRASDAASTDRASRCGRSLTSVMAALPTAVDVARTLYTRLRAADHAGASVILAIVPPAVGLGHAIVDRLTKAAAPRS